MIYFLLTLLFIILTYIILKFSFQNRKICFKNANILIIGGTSGLGEHLAQLLKSLQANVTISARRSNENMKNFNFLQLDVTDLATFTESNTNYDYIFCCAGSAIPGYFYNTELCFYKKQMELNYFGTINVLSYYYKNNKKPFSFIMIASTVAYFTFPGYSAYAPTKAALKSFFDSAYLELRKNNVFLYIYYLGATQTPGFETEKSTKPDFTKSIEGKYGMNPKTKAEILLKRMGYENEICSDFMTKIFKTKCEINSVKDYFYMGLSLFIFPFAKLYIRYRFRKTQLI